ncbi:MAG: signal peptidase I [Lachnospiraceae bacterium]|nr:signal peptidase I [Lachnospiraceae bacterium]
MFKVFKKKPEMKPEDIPTLEQIENEYERVKYKKRYRSVLASTVYALITVAAVAVLVATLLLPVLQIYGTSMTPCLTEGDIVVSVKGSNFNRGDIISFYYNNKILVKRVIAMEGEWVDITEEGVVLVNGEQLDEPYLREKAFGDCDIKLPYQVPDGRVFVMGDHRSTSQDSRNTAIGCVTEEQIVGKIVYCVWPLKDFGKLE